MAQQRARGRIGRSAMRLGPLALLALPAAAWTQTTAAPGFGPFLETDIPFDLAEGRNVGVLERDRPEYAPVGVIAGSFLLHPSIDLGAGGTSNVYGSRTGAQSDAFFTINPEFAAQSNWSRHSASLVAGANLLRQASQSLRDETGLYARADGRIDLLGDSNVVGSAGIRRAYESQYSGSFPTNSASPVKYVAETALLRGTYVTGRFRMTLAGDINDLNFSNSRRIDGTVLDQNFRDRTIYRTSGRVEYSIKPEWRAFVQATYDKTDYRGLTNQLREADATNPGDPNDPNNPNVQIRRDGQEIRLLAGFSSDLTALIRGSAGIGYTRRTFSGPYPTVSGIAYDVRLEYFMTELTTLSIGANRTVEDSVVFGSGGFFASSFELRADHELLRNFLLFAEGDYQHDKFTGATRLDDFYRVQGGATYLANRALKLVGQVSYLKRNSSGLPIGQVFNETRGTLTATFTL